MDKRPQKEEKVFICFWKRVECKHIVFVMQLPEKIFDVGQKLSKCLTVSLPLKKIYCFEHTIGFLRFVFLFSGNIRYLINYLQLTRKATEINFYKTSQLSFAVCCPASLNLLLFHVFHPIRI